MLRIHWDRHGMDPAVSGLPDIVDAAPWRVDRAVWLRRHYEARQLREDWLAHERGMINPGPIASESSRRRASLIGVATGDLRADWLTFANRWFAPIFARADAAYWIGHGPHGDLWHMAGLSRGAREDACLRAERLVRGMLA